VRSQRRESKRRERGESKCALPGGSSRLKSDRISFPPGYEYARDLIIIDPVSSSAGAAASVGCVPSTILRRLGDEIVTDGGVVGVCARVVTKAFKIKCSCRRGSLTSPTPRSPENGQWQWACHVATDDVITDKWLGSARRYQLTLALPRKREECAQILYPIGPCTSPQRNAHSRTPLLSTCQPSPVSLCASRPPRSGARRCPGRGVGCGRRLPGRQRVHLHPTWHAM
jgi:hypothetical protein